MFSFMRQAWRIATLANRFTIVVHGAMLTALLSQRPESDKIKRDLKRSRALNGNLQREIGRLNAEKGMDGRRGKEE